MQGKLFWITGLPGAGKTSIAKAFHETLKKHQHDVIYLDGDIIRNVLGGKHGYATEERFQLAMVYCRMSKMLTDQGFDVICATVSLFEECWNWNRDNISNYIDILVDVPMEVLIERDQKKLYSRALAGEIKDVMGVDIPHQYPKNPKLTVKNDGSASPVEIADMLMQKFYS